ncbi:unnamed protein product [Ascophyllum nodosum]
MAPSNCSNGLNGVKNALGTVCCPETCGVCDGSDCSSIHGTTADDCCASNIIDSGMYCGDGVEAPCTLLINTTSAPSVTAAADSFTPSIHSSTPFTPIPITGLGTTGPTAVTMSPGRGVISGTSCKCGRRSRWCFGHSYSHRCCRVVRSTTAAICR